MKRNFTKTLPVLVGYSVIGIGFGISLQSHGYGVLWALAMSVFIYAGSMQYLAVNLLSAGTGLLTVAVTTLMVNARHLFYGISMVDRYRDAGVYKPYLIFALTDETYSLVCNDTELSPRDTFQITLFNQIYWVAGSVVGSVMGQYLPFDFSGIDFALTALFVSIVAEQWLTQKGRFPALIGILASVVCLLLFGSEQFLIPSMVAITLALFGARAVRKEGGV